MSLATFSNFFNLASSDGQWATKEGQRKFFDDFARERGFDPLVATNWYNVSCYAIYETKVDYFNTIEARDNHEFSMPEQF